MHRGQSNSEKRNPYVFGVGCPRSGTTLLQRMLNNHPDLAVCNDSTFIVSVLRRSWNGQQPELTTDLVDRVRNYKRIHRMHLADEVILASAEGAQTYSEFVTAVYSAYAEANGKKFAGEKTPDFVLSLPMLDSLFPWARSIHIIRDGRDVALSTLDWANEGKGPGRVALWKEEPVAVCALWWKRRVETGRRDGASIGPARYHEVSYENLSADPEPLLHRMTDFLDLPYAPEMAQYHLGKEKRGTKLSAKSAWLPPTTGLRDWRVQMQPRDVELFEALAGDLLSDLGYERAAPTTSPSVAKVAERCLAVLSR